MLRLPLEFKSKIFSHVLGQRDINVGYSIKRAKFRVRVQGNDYKTFLNILRTSRQIYVEANPVFWSTNKFMFAEPTAFKKWMRDRTTHEKRLIGSIQLAMHISNKSELGNTPYYWNNALCEGVVKSLPGLLSLHLRIRQNLYHKETDDEDIDIEYMLKGALLGVERFAKLPLKNVKVSIVNLLKIGDREWPLSMWVTADKFNMAAVAMTLREKLLQTNTAIAE